MQTQAKDYWKLFRPSACNLALKGTTREEVFEEIVSTLIKAKQLPEELRIPALAALIRREELASTGVGHGVAIPHVQLEGVEEAVVSLSLHPSGVEWRSLDGEPVKILFTVLRPAEKGPRHDPDRHLEMMQWIANLSRDADFRRFALAVKNRTELVDLLKEMAGL